MSIHTNTEDRKSLDVAKDPSLKKKKRKHRKVDEDAKNKRKSKKKRDDSEHKSPDSPAQPAAPDEKRKKKRKRETKEKPPVEPEDDTREKSSEEKQEKKKRRRKVVDGADATTKDAEQEESRTEPQSTEAVPPPKPKSISFPSDTEVSGYLSKHGVTINSGTSDGPDTTLPDDLRPILSFASLLPRIPEPLYSAFESFKEPTPIQACSWPASLDGRDVVGIAETGSGKTLAFGIPAVSHIIKNGINLNTASKKSKSKSKSKHGNKAQISVLAVAPTRELALQTHETFTKLGKPFGLTSIAVYGGVDKEPQRHALVEKGAAMIVGTPGRILDLVNEGSCDLSGVTYLVLDEADRMLDKGFENDIRTIIGNCAPSEKRQTLMFSATWPEAVRRLASTFQQNPVRVTIGSDDLTANRRVEQVVEVFDDQREKDSRLLSHLRRLNARKGSKKSEDEPRILIFVLYKKEASRVEQTLQRQGFSVGGIHGDLSQVARTAALEDFKKGKTQFLVATDVAARGLDIPNVGTVINYSFPLTVEDYVHRIGRTGRGGRSGKSITFFTGDNHEKALAGELAKVMREGGFDTTPLKKFPMTIKKKEHGVYGAFYRDDIPMDAKPQKLKFD